MREQLGENVNENITMIPDGEVEETETIEIPNEEANEAEPIEISAEEVNEGDETAAQVEEVSGVDAAADVKNSPAKKSDKRKTVAVAGMVCGAIILFMGLLSMGGAFYDGSDGATTVSSTTHSSYEWYGGDAYTGIQQAAVDASNNAKAAAENITLTNYYLYAISSLIGKGIGALLIALGLMTFMKYLNKYVDLKE